MSLLAASIANSQPLPQRAKIIVDGRFQGDGVGSSESYCKQVTVTPTSIAHRFRRYHPITFNDLHDYYDFVDCGNEGRILLDGKTYAWRLYITDEIETTYPDGQQKMLAGKAHPVH